MGVACVCVCVCVCKRERESERESLTRTDPRTCFFPTWGGVSPTIFLIFFFAPCLTSNLIIGLCDNSYLYV